MPRLGKVFGRHDSGQVQLLGVVCGSDTEATAEQFAQKAGLRFPLAMDPDRSIRTRFGTYRVPTVVVVGGDGRTLATYVGGTEQLPDVVDKTLTALETGAPLPDYDQIGGG